ncbi:YfbU family protein [Corynebacterium kozikiae]|uniref:YfbU family protein n=1 Tax=Corynebacterium kozikiae TaxID=2968469 RepID=UPI00211C60C7|nr:YfbU family protein [Corynebacterium sp. 76QC2CO]MCQ9343838.1 YfbU family protein [Corynebacterium sp. 76QC2CO]
MATVTIRLEDELKKDLEAVAAGRNQNVSELVRELIEDFLSPGEVDRPGTVLAPKTLTAYERQSLATLHRILARLVGDDNLEDGDKEYQLRQAKILESGFTGLYGQEFIGISPELSQADCTLVMDILDMFRMIDAGLKALEEDGETLDIDNKFMLTFDGFDFQIEREAAMADLVKYFVEEGRWVEHAKMIKETGGNSHGQRLPMYQAMLGEYNAVMEARRLNGRGFSYTPLNKEEITQIANAKTGGRQLKTSREW